MLLISAKLPLLHYRITSESLILAFDGLFLIFCSFSIALDRSDDLLPCVRT